MNLGSNSNRACTTDTTLCRIAALRLMTYSSHSRMPHKTSMCAGMRGMQYFSLFRPHRGDRYGDRQ